MAAFINDDSLDALLDDIATATRLHICSSQPADFAAVSGATLASVAVDSGDFAVANHATSGRQVTVAAQSGVSVSASGDPQYYVLVNTAGSRLIAYTEVDSGSPDLTSGSTVNIPAVIFSVADPTVV